MLEDEINMHFDFLVKEHFFKKVPEYCSVREIHNDYIRGYIIVKIIFEGDYILEIIKLNHIDSELLNFNRKSVELNKNEYKVYYLNDLKKIKKNSLEELSNGIRENIELLDGNFEKFTIKYKLFNFLRKL